MFGQGLRQPDGGGSRDGARLCPSYSVYRKGKARRNGEQEETLPGEAVGGRALARLAFEVPGDAYSLEKKARNYLGLVRLAAPCSGIVVSTVYPFYSYLNQENLHAGLARAYSCEPIIPSIPSRRCPVTVFRLDAALAPWPRHSEPNRIWAQRKMGHLGDTPAPPSRVNCHL